MENEATDRDTLIFLHIPKTAGITLNTILEKQYSKERSYSTSMSGHHPGGSLDGFAALPQDRKRKLRLLYGHMGFGLHEALRRPATYFTFLREPVERVVSHYFYEAREPRGPYYELIKAGEMDFDGYIRHMSALEMDNLQTRMISGNWHKRGFGACDEEMLAMAKHNLSHHFAVVGLTESFDKSYLMLKRVFGWKHIYYTKRNVTRNRPTRNDISAASLRLVRKANRFDIALYQFASERFESQIQRQGLQFIVALRLFQIAKFMRTWALPLYHDLRKWSVRTYIKQRWQQNSG